MEKPRFLTLNRRIYKGDVIHVRPECIVAVEEDRGQISRGHCVIVTVDGTYTEVLHSAREVCDHAAAILSDIQNA